MVDHENVSDAWVRGRRLRASSMSSASSRWRAIVFGDGIGAITSQTGAERQALALASALLRSAALAPTESSSANSSGWNVRAASLSAVQHPMPRLFRPLPDGGLRLQATRAAGLAFLSSGLARRALPASLVAGNPVPAPFDAATGDFSRTLIVAAGSAASAPALLAHGRMRGSKMIQLLHPRRSLELFDVVVAPEHDFSSGAAVPENVVTTYGSLHDINRSRLKAHAEKNPCEDILALASPRVGVALGGPRGSLGWSDGWDDTAAMQMAADVAELAGADGSVVITVSRRTPQRFTVRFQRELVRRFGSSRVLFDDGTLRSRYLFILATSHKLVVTADSVNMLSEAVASGQPVFIAGKSRSSRVAQFCRSLVGSGLAKELGRPCSALRAAGGLEAAAPTVPKANGLADGLTQVDRVAGSVWQLLRSRAG